jgi:hypothetical protein
MYLDDFDFRKRKYHAPAIRQKFGFALDCALFECHGRTKVLVLGVNAPNGAAVATCEQLAITRICAAFPDPRRYPSAPKKGGK